MSDRLARFRAGELGIAPLINDLEALRYELQSADDEWIDRFIDACGELEIPYAVALDRLEASRARTRRTPRAGPKRGDRPRSDHHAARRSRQRRQAPPPRTPNASGLRPRRADASSAVRQSAGLVRLGDRGHRGKPFTASTFVGDDVAALDSPARPRWAEQLAVDQILHPRRRHAEQLRRIGERQQLGRGIYGQVVNGTATQRRTLTSSGRSANRSATSDPR